jgi:hypothetical protein
VIGQTRVPDPPRRAAPRWITCALLVFAAGVFPRAALAQWVLIQPFIGLSFGGNTNIVDLEDATKLRKAIYGGTVTVIGRGIFGAEGDLGYIPGFFQRGDSQLVTGSRVVTVMGNVVIAAPLRWTGDSLRPYASGGLGLMRTRVDDVLDIFTANRSLVGINVGGGAMGFFTERVGVRWDVRYFKSVSDLDEEREPVAFGTARLSFWRATTALVLKY